MAETSGAGTGTLPGRAARRRTRRWALITAAVAVLAAGGITWALITSGPGPAPGSRPYGGYAGIPVVSQVTAQVRATLAYFQSNVTSLAISPDGTRVASADDTGDLRLWNLTTDRPIPLTGGGEAATFGLAATFSPDGTILAAAVPGGVSLWNARTGRFLRVLTHAGPTAPQAPQIPLQADAIAYSPNGNWLATGTIGGYTLLWQVATGQTFTMAQPAADLRGTGGIFAVAFSPDSKTLAAGDSSSQVLLYDVAGRTLQATLTNHGPDPRLGAGTAYGVLTLSYGDHGRLLAAGDLDGHVYLWDMTARQNLGYTASGADGVLSGDGRLLAWAPHAGNGNGVHVTSAATGSTVANGGDLTVAPFPDSESAVAINATGTLVAFANRDRITVWTIRTVPSARA
jgi:WD40 repeat protein